MRYIAIVAIAVVAHLNVHSAVRPRETRCACCEVCREQSRLSPYCRRCDWPADSVITLLRGVGYFLPREFFSQWADYALQSPRDQGCSLTPICPSVSHTVTPRGGRKTRA
jgi:hypothetical protein